MASDTFLGKGEILCHLRRLTVTKNLVAIIQSFCKTSFSVILKEVKEL